MYLFNSHVTMFTLFRFDAFLIKIKCCMTVACSIVHFKGYVNKCIYQINCKFIPDQFHFILTLFVAEKVLKKVCRYES